MDSAQRIKVFLEIWRRRRKSSILESSNSFKSNSKKVNFLEKLQDFSKKVNFLEKLQDFFFAFQLGGKLSIMLIFWQIWVILLKVVPLSFPQQFLK